MLKRSSNLSDFAFTGRQVACSVLLAFVFITMPSTAQEGKYSKPEDGKYSKPEDGKYFKPEEVFQLVRRLQESKPFTEDAIEKATGRKLTQHAVWYKTSDRRDDELIICVEASNDRSGNITAVTLNLNRSLRITPDDVRKAFGKWKRISHNPALHGKDNTHPINYVYERKKGEFTSFEFEKEQNSSVLRAVHI